MNKIEINQNINKLLLPTKAIAVFYTEGGSRLLKVENEFSDYDVRGVHLLNKENYISFLPKPEMIETIDTVAKSNTTAKEKEQPNSKVLDFVSFEWDKFLNMLLKSNPNVWEFWRSEYFYLNQIADFNYWQKETTALVNFQNLYYHYLSFAKGQGNLLAKKPTYKVLFYSLRAILFALYAQQSVLAAINARQLLAQSLAESNLAIQNIAKHYEEALFYKQNEHKKQLNENLQTFFTELIATETSKLLSLRPSFENKENQLKELLLSLNKQVKNQFYNL